MILFLFLFAPSLLLADPVCTPTRPLSLDAEVMESKARAANGELCATAGTTAPDADQTKLLGLIRDEAVKRLDRVKPGEFDETKMREGHARLRAFQALRHAVLTDSPDGVRLSPAVALVSPAGLPKPEPLRPADADLARAAYQKDLAELQTKLVGSTGKDRRRLITQWATPLQERIRSTGEFGYNDTVSGHPALLFVGAASPSAADLRAAHAKYFESVRAQVDQMRQMPIKPEGDALGLIFFGPALKEALRAEPNLCAAYNALRERARATEQFRKLANAGMGIAAGGACMLTGLFSVGALTSACLALTTGELVVAGLSAVRTFREKEMLYGGLMQGAAATEYEAKQRESQGYLIAAGLSATGAGGAFVAARTARISAETEALVQEAHLVGKGEVGRNGQLAGIGNYTDDQIRRKVAVLKRSKQISRDERKALIRSGRVGVADPEALSRAESSLNTLRNMPRERIDAKTLRSLEQRLEVCVKTSKKCDEAYKAIADAFATENKHYAKGISDLERRLEVEAGTTTDEAHFDNLTEVLAKLAACRENPALPGCAEVTRTAERFVPAAKVALRGPPPHNPARPWTSTKKPIDEVSNLTFMDEANRTTLARLMKEAEDTPQALARRDNARRKDQASYTPVDNLNSTLKEILGNKIIVERQDSKILLHSDDRKLSVILDPATRYFTVSGIDRFTGRSEKYIYLLKEDDGHFKLIYVNRYEHLEPAEFMRISHFGY